MIIDHNNIFTSGAQTLVCPVNRVGVMGNGLALYFSLRYKGLKEAYVRACEEDVFDMKGFFIHDQTPNLKILCFPTKHHWAKPSNINDIESTLLDIRNTYRELGITSLAMPLVGCGKGGLSPHDVIYLIERYLGQLDIPVYLSRRF